MTVKDLRVHNAVIVAALVVMCVTLGLVIKWGCTGHGRFSSRENDTLDRVKECFDGVLSDLIGGLVLRETYIKVVSLIAMRKVRVRVDRE